MFTSWILRNMDEKQRKQVCWDRELQVKMNQSPPSTSPNSDWGEEFEKKPEDIPSAIHIIYILRTEDV